MAFKLIDQETMCCLAYCFIRSKYLSLNYTNTKVEYFLNIGEFSEGIIKEVEEYELIDSYKRIPCSKQGLKCLQAKPREKWEHACLNQIMATSTGS